MVERAHRQLKDTLRVRTAGGNWASHLPWVLLGMWVAPKEDSNLFSAELVYGAPLVTPGQIPGVPEPPPAVFQEAVRVAPLTHHQEELIAYSSSRVHPSCPGRFIFCLH